ncbi:hypothetical protein WMY93_018553 [Mugilogobius chulae]|uniref:Uncharacterized protein n=1 Tax=Mugilogobius chulae TaxID=88201 RepID=A0AAW0NQP3_9GOBI
MVSYTRTSPPVSFSVNPLLHDFRAETREAPRTKEKNWVNSQASRRADSEWGQDFRKLPSGGAACNAAFIPSSDTETPHCLAITSNAWEAHVATETQPGENCVIPECVATRRESFRKRTLDEAINLDAQWSQTVEQNVEHISESKQAEIHCDDVAGQVQAKEDSRVVVLIGERPKADEQKKKQVQKMRKTRTTEREWTCLPLPQPVYLRQHFQFLSVPAPPFAPVPAVSPHHPPVLPPLLPPAFYASAPVPFVDGPPSPYVMPAFSPRLYSPPPAPFLPLHYVFRLLD